MDKKLKIGLSLFFSLSILAFGSTIVLADSKNLPDSKIDNIINNCSSIKHSLKNAQVLDSKTRVALGTTYQTILSKYITPLNVRLLKNNNSNQILTDIQTTFSSNRENFNHLFIVYSQKLENLIATDCKEEPEYFYELLEETRQARKNLNNSVVKVSQNLDEHILEVEKLKSTYTGEKK